MPPRKAQAATTAADGESAQPPRRSSRISSSAAAKETTLEKPSMNSRKRAAKGEPVDGKGNTTGSSSKKAKSGEKGENEEDGKDTTSAQLQAIDLGDSLPSLTLKNEKDEDLQVGELATEKGVVLFLVPKADTPGCTNQACGFRDIYPDFTGLGYDVYCLSADSPNAQKKWQTKKELPYPLISDPKRILISALGAGEGGKTKRSHFIFEKGGQLVEKKIPVKPVDSPKLALDFIKGQSGQSS